MKKHFLTILYFIVALSLGYWWYYTFTYTPTVTLIYINDGITETHKIAFDLTTLIIKNEEDSSYVFYNKKGEPVIIVEDSNWDKITIIKK